MMFPTSIALVINSSVNLLIHSFIHFSIYLFINFFINFFINVKLYSICLFSTLMSLEFKV